MSVCEELPQGPGASLQRMNAADQQNRYPVVALTRPVVRGGLRVVLLAAGPSLLLRCQA